MIRYKVSTEHPHRHFISFEAQFPTYGKNKVLLQLPAWRPGRYELGNFSKNIRAWEATDEHNNRLAFSKIDKNLWQVESHGVDAISIRYQYYASELNAGSSYLDEWQLYINPVNCFFYLPEFPHENFEVELVMDPSYRLASALALPDSRLLAAKDFNELADSPFIASASITEHRYAVEGTTFYVWMNGENAVDVNMLLSSFEKFTKLQLCIFGHIPCTAYHFLFQFPPFAVRHGVEHITSTVVALGPAGQVHTEKLYNELLAISCHELFHVWNVKTIRPAEMLPYDFTKENYSELGFVYEGVTTYYGDLVLLRSRVWSESKWLESFSEEVNKHLNNPGRLNHSVAQSSFDTWLDGYVPGIPWRKVSIYTEGCLIAFICDIMILRATGNKKSLDDVMRMMFELFGTKKVGYTRSDYQNALEAVSGISFSDFFSDFVRSPVTYLPALDNALKYIGCEISETTSPNSSERCFGFSVTDDNGRVVVVRVEENSPADKSQLWEGDEIVAVNGITASSGLPAMPEAVMHSEIELTVKKKMKTVQLKIQAAESKCGRLYRVNRSPQSDDDQEQNWKFFSGKRLD